MQPIILLYINPTALFIIRIVAAFLAAVLIFLLSGFTYVKKNRFAFVSKRGKLKMIWDEGWHYSFPWRYKISKSYSKGPFDISWRMHGSRYLTASLMIRDPKRLFASRKNLKKLLKNEVNKAKNNIEIRSKVENAYKRCGVELINLIVTERN